MPDDGNIKSCSYYLVRYVPNSEREEFLNIGVLLHCPEEQFMDCLFSGDVHRIRRFHPHADSELLRDLQQHFEKQIQQHEDELDALLKGMQQSYSHLIQLAPARPVLSADPAAELHRAFERLVDQRLPHVPTVDTRMRIRQRFVEALERARIFHDHRLERRIPAARLTPTGNPLHFDFGYHPASTAGQADGRLKLLHALSLQRDPSLASVLALSMGYIRERQAVELTAIVEGQPARNDETASHSFRILADAGIAMRPVAEADSLAAEIHGELSPEV